MKSIIFKYSAANFVSKKEIYRVKKHVNNDNVLQRFSIIELFNVS